MTAETAATNASVDPLLGRKVGAYVIRRRIGEGGMGVVYEAQHERLSQRAAIKFLHPELSREEKILQRFFNEARAISLAQHSSIVKIYDCAQLEDGTAYILMEFLEGELLLHRLERAQDAGTGLSLKLVAELGRQLAAALAMIHSKGIIHRDLKPDSEKTHSQRAAFVPHRTPAACANFASSTSIAVHITTRTPRT